MLDAHDRYELLHRVERLLVALRPTLLTGSQSACREAGAIVSAIVTGSFSDPSAATDRLYADAACAPPPEPPPHSLVRLPKHAMGEFPYNAPSRPLREVQAQIEAMLPYGNRRKPAPSESAEALKLAAAPLHERAQSEKRR